MDGWTDKQFFDSLALKAGCLGASYSLLLPGLHGSLTEGRKEGKGCSGLSLVRACMLVHLILRRGRDFCAQIGRLRLGEVRRRPWGHSSSWLCQGPMPGLNMQRYLRNADWLNQCMYMSAMMTAAAPSPFLCHLWAGLGQDRGH